MTDFVFKNPECAERGFHGWLHAETREVYFCRRVEHFDLLNYGVLAGIAENEVFDNVETGPRSTGWADIVSWASDRGWIHFVSHEDYIEFKFPSGDQVAVCKDFAREANMEARFK